MVTLADVAKKANVSKMTVSRVINNPEKVTDELKQLVFQAMKELNYKPNVAAKALANNRTHIIKLFILEEMDTTEPYYMNLLMGISKELDKHQYSLQLVTENGFDIGLCDGYIITGMRDEDYEWIHRIENPIILFGENKYGYDFVDTDNQRGTYLSTKHVLERGYEEIIYIGIDVDEPFEISREAGYLQAMREKNKKTNIVRFQNRSRYSAGYIEENFDSFEKNTAFVCSSDRLAFGVIRGLLEKEGKVPEEFGVVGFDGVFLDQIAYPRLTTVKQSVIDMGQACAKMLLKKIDEDGVSQGNNWFQPELIVRGSTR